MPGLNGATQDRVILRARDYKLLFPRHPLSQIYPSTTDLPASPARRPHLSRPSLCFLIRNFVTSPVSLVGPKTIAYTRPPSFGACFAPTPGRSVFTGRPSIQSMVSPSSTFVNDYFSEEIWPSAVGEAFCIYSLLER